MHIFYCLGRSLVSWATHKDAFAAHLLVFVTVNVLHALSLVPCWKCYVTVTRSDPGDLPSQVWIHEANMFRHHQERVHVWKGLNSHHHPFFSLFFNSTYTCSVPFMSLVFLFSLNGQVYFSNLLPALSLELLPAGKRYLCSVFSIVLLDHLPICGVCIHIDLPVVGGGVVCFCTPVF